MELSTSEWKRKKPPTAKCLQQQAKNIRINKAILRHFLDLPISETDKNKAMALDMDWTGTMGYMFAVKPLDDLMMSLSLEHYIHSLCPHILINHLLLLILLTIFIHGVIIMFISRLSCVSAYH
ncbi:hypothetical protein PS15m_008262 [Mucor circinelloides]